MWLKESPAITFNFIMKLYFLSNRIFLRQQITDHWFLKRKIKKEAGFWIMVYCVLEQFSITILNCGWFKIIQVYFMKIKKFFPFLLAVLIFIISNFIQNNIGDDKKNIEGNKPDPNIQRHPVEIFHASSYQPAMVAFTK